MEKEYSKCFDLKRYQRIQGLLLREIDWTYEKIALQLQITQHQVHIYIYNTLVILSQDKTDPP